VSGSKIDFESAPKADFTNMPLPPEGAEGEPTSASGRPGEDKNSSRAEESVAVLEFLDPAAMTKTVVLSFPFYLGGDVPRRLVGELIVRRLSYAQVARVYERAAGGGEVKLVEFYAEMTGLPAAVLRALEASDAQRIVDACHPFLPPAVRGES
jgi:hypothetical protein